MKVMSPPSRAGADVAEVDVVVVGAGIAGLTAAWQLRERKMLVLEASDRVGGRMRSEPWGDYWLNYGAHLFPAPGSIVDGIARELELESVPVWGSMMGLAMGSRKLVSGPVESYPLRLPLSLTERAAFAIRGLRVQSAVRRYHAVSRPRADEGPAETRARVLAHEDARTFGELLGPMPTRVRQIFSTAAHRATAELEELSAGCGIGLFALVWGGKGSLIARNLIGGSARLPMAMAERLGAERVRLSSKVVAIRERGERLEVEYHSGGTEHRVRARHVVMAAQAPYAAGLVAQVAPQAAAALSKMSYGAFLNVAVATREKGPMPWDKTYAMATPGRVFDMFTNQAHALRREGARKPGGALMLFAGGHAAAELSTASDEVIAGRFVDDLTDLFPEAKGIVEEARVQRWALGNVFAKPGRHLLQQPLEGALGQHRNLHLAGDYFAELGNLEAAAKTGVHAATRVAGELDAAGRSATSRQS